MSELNVLPSWAQNIVIVTHNAPLRRPGEWRAFFPRGKAVAWLWDYAFLAHRAEEAREFAIGLSALADRHHGVNFFVLCGHRHTPICGQVGKIIILEAASLSEESAATWLVFAQGSRVHVFD